MRSSGYLTTAQEDARTAATTRKTREAQLRNDAVSNTVAALGQGHVQMAIVRFKMAVEAQGRLAQCGSYAVLPMAEGHYPVSPNAERIAQNLWRHIARRRGLTGRAA